MPALDEFQVAEFNNHYRDSYAQIRRNGRDYLVYVQGLVRDGETIRPHDEDEEDEEGDDLRLAERRPTDRSTPVSISIYDTDADAPRLETVSMEDINPPYIPSGFFNIEGGRVGMFSRTPLAQIRRGINGQNSNLWKVGVQQNELILSDLPFHRNHLIRHHNFSLNIAQPNRRFSSRATIRSIWERGLGGGFALNRYYALIQGERERHDQVTFLTTWSGPIAVVELTQAGIRLNVPRHLGYVREGLAAQLGHVFNDEVAINVR